MDCTAVEAGGGVGPEFVLLLQANSQFDSHRYSWFIQSLPDFEMLNGLARMISAYSDWICCTPADDSDLRLSVDSARFRRRDENRL